MVYATVRVQWKTVLIFFSLTLQIIIIMKVYFRLVTWKPTCFAVWKQIRCGNDVEIRLRACVCQINLAYIPQNFLQLEWLSTGTLNCLSNNVNGRNDVRHDCCCKLIGRQSAFTFMPRAAYTIFWIADFVLMVLTHSPLCVKVKHTVKLCMHSLVSCSTVSMPGDEVPRGQTVSLQ